MGKRGEQKKFDNGKQNILHQNIQIELEPFTIVVSHVERLNIYCSMYPAENILPRELSVSRASPPCLRLWRARSSIFPSLREGFTRHWRSDIETNVSWRFIDGQSLIFYSWLHRSPARPHSRHEQWKSIHCRPEEAKKKQIDCPLPFFLSRVICAG